MVGGREGERGSPDASESATRDTSHENACDAARCCESARHSALSASFPSLPPPTPTRCFVFPLHSFPLRWSPHRPHLELSGYSWGFPCPSLRLFLRHLTFGETPRLVDMLRQHCRKTLQCSRARIVTRAPSRSMATHSASAEAGMADPAAYCKDLVRKRDYESYLIGAFYPRHFQGAFFALRAFYVSVCSCTLQYPLARCECGNMGRPAAYIAGRYCDRRLVTTMYPALAIDDVHWRHCMLELGPLHRRGKMTCSDLFKLYPDIRTFVTDTNLLCRSCSHSRHPHSDRALLT